VLEAGHPHWQIDILESMRRTRPEVHVRFDSNTSSQEPKDFGDVIDDNEKPDLLLGLTIEKTHLASATTFWRSQDEPIAHAPVSVKEVNQWVLGSIKYLKREASRCVIQPLDRSS
jgi:hypothetical protein